MVSKILILDAGVSALNAAIFSVLVDIGIADKFIIVDEKNAHEHLDDMVSIIEAMPESECDFHIDFHPQLTYSGPPIKGKKGKFKRW